MRVSYYGYSLKLNFSIQTGIFSDFFDAKIGMFFIFK